MQAALKLGGVSNAARPSSGASLRPELLGTRAGRQALVSLSLLLLSIFWVASGYAAHTSTACTQRTATVSNGGSVQIDLNPCHTNSLFPPFGLGPVNGPALPANGTAILGESFTAPSTYAAFVRYTHNGNAATSDAFEFSDVSGNTVRVAVTITPATSLITVTPAVLPAMTVGSAFSQALASSGGSAPYTYSLQSGSLPPGLSMVAGVISGTPTQRGAYAFTVRSLDSASQFVDKSYGGTIAAPSLSIAQASATALQNAAFSHTLAIAGGVSPHSCLLEAGTLPVGISVSSGCVISGTTSAAPGSFPVTIRVTDASTGPGSYFELETFTLTVSGPPSVSISVSPSSVSEDGASNLVFTVTRSLNLSSPTTVNISTSGIATSGTDYTGGVATIDIPAGATTATITINPTADSTVEPDETVILTVAAGTGYTVGVPASATGTILNDDVPTATIAVSPANVAEDGAPNMVFTVTLSQASASATSINFNIGGTATNGTDYATITSPLVIPAGSTTGTITVNPTADATIEADETVSLTLAAGAGYTVGSPASAFGTILNDDLPNLVINDVTAAEGNAGTTNFTFTVSLSAPAGPGGVTFDIATANGSATAGTDYVARSLTSQTIPAGSSTYTFTVLVNGDTLNEPSETFFVNVTNVSNAVVTDGQGVGTIANDDPLPSLSINDVTVVEGNSGTVNVVFTVALGAASGQTVSVNYATADGTATQPADYSSTSGTVTFTPGQTTRTITVPVIGDTVPEANETFFVNLSGATNATISDNQGLGTITNDDVPVTVSPGSLSNGTVAAAYSQTLTGNGGVAPYAFSVTAGTLPTGLTLTTGGALSGTPTAGGNFNFTVTATDSSGAPGPFAGTQAYTVTIASPTISLQTTMLAGGTFGAAYSASINAATGGTAPYAYVVTAGALPGGLALNTATGAITGTPSAAGTFSFSVTATDSSTGTGPYTGTRAYSLVVGQAAQTISFGALASKTFGDAVFTVSATGGASGNAVTFASQTTGVCTTAGTNGSSVTLVGAGTCTIRASQAGNTNYAAAPNVDQSFTVGQGSQTITFTNPGAQTYSPSGTFSVSASSTSMLTVAFTSGSTNVCTVTGTTVTILTAGTCVINANQAGNSTFAAAPQVTNNITIAKANQATLTAASTATTLNVGGTATLSTTGGSGTGAVTYASDNANCTVSSTTLTAAAAGGCTITATKAADTNYNAATGTVAITTNLVPQTIAFTSPGVQTYAPSGTFSVAASSTSMLTVAFTSGSTSVCTVSGTTVSILTAGTCVINADQAGNGTFAAAPQVTQNITIGKAAQATLVAASTATALNVGATATLSTTGGSGTGAVTFASNNSNCTVSGTTLTAAAGGSCTITATKAADTNYNAATGTVAITIAVPQTITFAGPSAQTYAPNGTFTVSASSTSMLTVAFSSSTTSVCTVSGNTVTVLRVGTCTIAADQAGNGTFAAAPQVTQNITINKANQATFTATSTATSLNVGSSATLGATGGSGTGAITFSSSDNFTCAVIGTTLTAGAAGGCTITVVKASDTNYNSASATIAIATTLAPQTITFTNPGAQTYSPSGTFSVSASNTSMLTVAFTSGSTNVCTVTGTTVTILTAGTCVINANQAGNSTFAAAPQVTNNITIAKANQATLTAASTATTLNVGGTATLSTTGGSGTGAVTYASDNANCTVTAGTTLTAAAAGGCTITATKAADTNYNAATGTIAITTNLVPQTITFTNPGAQVYSPSGTFTVSASSTSMLTVAFTSSSTSVCTVTGTTVSILAAGTCVINADQAGNGTFAAAPQVTNSITIGKATQATLTAASTATTLNVGATATLSTTGGSGTGAVTFASNNSNCTIAGTTLTAAATGGCTITATKAADTNYNVATSAALAINTSPTAQTITFTNPGAQTYAPNGTFTVSASSTSMLTVAFTSGSTSVCTVTGTTVSILTAGTCVINADQAGNSTFAAAPQVTNNITINKANQATLTATSTFTTLNVGGTATLGSTGGNGTGAVTFASNNANCTVSSTTLTAAAAGGCTITATKAADTNYNAASSAALAINTSTTAQTITFTNPAAQTYAPNGTFIVSATSSANLPVTFTALTPTVCTVEANTGLVTIRSAGQCGLAADQAGNTTVGAAARVSVMVIISPASQTVRFDQIADRVFSRAAVNLAATASSTLPVVFSSLTPTVCSVTGDNLTMLLVGTCTIRASQAGNANYSSASTERSFRITTPITAAAATLVSSLNPAIVGRDITLTARITGTNPTGTVSFIALGNSGPVSMCAAAAIVNEIATCLVPAANRTLGNHVYIVRYQGDAANRTASASLIQTVSQSGTSVTLSATPVRPTAGQPLILTALVDGVAPTGTVRFHDAGVNLAGCAAVPLVALPLDVGNSGAANNAVATCVIPSVTAGSRNFTAVYSGDANNVGSQASQAFVVPATGPIDYSDLWWSGRDEDGWGMTIMQKGAVQFNAFYVYDAQGKPTWFVMPGGTWSNNFTTYTGALFATTSAPYFAYDRSSFAVSPSTGTGVLTFTSNNVATFDYTINGVTGRKTIERQPFGTRDNAARVVIRDLWWGGVDENGWGISIAQQDRTLFAVWFTYDAEGKPTWFVMPGGKWDGKVFTGDLYTTTSSPWFGATYDATKFRSTKVGSLTLNFTDQDNVTMVYTIDGVTQSKVITRQPF